MSNLTKSPLSWRRKWCKGGCHGNFSPAPLQENSKIGHPFPKSTAQSGSLGVCRWIMEEKFWHREREGAQDNVQVHRFVCSLSIWPPDMAVFSRAEKGPTTTLRFSNRTDIRYLHIPDVFCVQHRLSNDRFKSRSKSQRKSHTRTDKTASLSGHQKGQNGEGNFLRLRHGIAANLAVVGGPWGGKDGGEIRQIAG